MDPRTSQEILTDFLTDKGTRPELAVLTNPSNASIWYVLYGAIAVQISAMEELTTGLLDDIEARALEIPVGTLLWYQYQTLQYQHGDSLTIIDGIPEYSVIDDLKKVVKVASATEQSGAILIKAAKLDLSDNPIPLSASELSGLQTYWTNRRFAGSFLSIISQAGDDMWAELTIEVDGSKISSTGESQSAPGTYPVEDAIKEFYKLLPFNGRFTVTGLVDAIQSVDGVGASVVPNTIKAKGTGASTYVDILQVSDQSYNPIAGYIIEDTAHLLSATLNYTVI